MRPHESRVSRVGHPCLKLVELFLFFNVIRSSLCLFIVLQSSTKLPRQTSHALTKREILFAFLRSSAKFRFVHEKCASQAYMITLLKGPDVFDGLNVSVWLA